MLQAALKLFKQFSSSVNQKQEVSSGVTLELEPLELFMAGFYLKYLKRSKCRSKPIKRFYCHHKLLEHSGLNDNSNLLYLVFIIWIGHSMVRTCKCVHKKSTRAVRHQFSPFSKWSLKKKKCCESHNFTWKLNSCNICDNCKLWCMFWILILTIRVGMLWPEYWFKLNLLHVLLLKKCRLLSKCFISVYRNFVVVNCTELQVAYRSNIIL